MAIVKMKKLLILAPKHSEKELMERLLLLGCVEVGSPEKALEDEEVASLVDVRTGQLPDMRARRAEFIEGISILDRYAPEKRGLLYQKPSVGARELLDGEQLEDTAEFVRKIDYFDDQIRRVNIVQGQQRSLIEALTPWAELDLPLDFSGTESCDIVFGTAPATGDLHEMTLALAQAAPESELMQINSDAEQLYLVLICLRQEREQALAALRAFGFAIAAFPESSKTAAEAIREARASVEELDIGKQGLTEMIVSGADKRGAIELCADMMSARIEREEAAEKLLRTEYAIALTGWASADKERELTALLDEYGCAWELTEPEEQEYPEVPVSLKNNWFTRPLNMVTEMYSLPAYGSLDPNPLMAPFFILFYGIMMADMGYGVLMMLGSLFMLKRMRVTGGMRNFAGLLGLCGVSTFIVGALTGGFFGDFIPQLVAIINPDTTFTELPSLFSPLDDTVMILIGAMCLGFIQIITGMAISFVSKIRDGDWFGAVFEEGTWWVLFLGIGFLALGIGNIAGVPVVLCIGGLMLIIGSARGRKGLGRITGVIGTIYNGVTGYFGDILSYSRLMALMLAGSVIAQVFNTIGAIMGNIVVFLIVSIVGNALNFALNLLGCFVHDLRLQCLEYFGKFYKDGGKPFKPLAINTKYVTVINDKNDK